jgi:transcription elongation factor GreA
MIHDETTYLTPEGLKHLKEELTHLKTEKLPQILEHLRETVADGDLDENPEYEDAVLEQQLIEERIVELEDTLKNSKVIEDSGPSNVVRMGSTVTISSEEWEEPETYRIVGEYESDPLSGLISHESPIGEALLGAKVGAVVSAETPRGVVQLKIVAIA